jgi:hypothetical protein
MRADACKNLTIRVSTELRSLCPSPYVRHMSNGIPPKFKELPEECTCLGEGPTPVRIVPAVGAMPKLVTYQCPACGHTETIEVRPTAFRFSSKIS